MKRTCLVVPIFLAAAAAIAQTQPITDPARTDDFSSPQGTIKSMANALRANDAKAYRAGYATKSDFAQQFADAFASVTATTAHLTNAVRAHLSDAPKSAALDLAGQFEGGFADAKLETSGDTAWLIPPGQTRETAMPFIKIGNDWKIDTESAFKLQTPEGRQGAQELIASGPKTAAALNPIIADIENGTIKSMAEMRKRMAAR